MCASRTMTPSPADALPLPSRRAAKCFNRSNPTGGDPPSGDAAHERLWASARGQSGRCKGLGFSGRSRHCKRLQGSARATRARTRRPVTRGGPQRSGAIAHGRTMVQAAARPFVSNHTASTRQSVPGARILDVSLWVACPYAERAPPYRWVGTRRAGRSLGRTPAR